MEPRALTCPHCGGRLEPGAEARVRCAHCGTVSEVVDQGALQAARALEKVGIRVPDNPMTIEEIEQELAERKAVEDSRRTTAIVITTVVLFATALVVILVVVSR